MNGFWRSVPNVLSTVRLVTGPIFAFLFLAGFPPEKITALFIVFALTDWLDGRIARRLKCETFFGKFIDPLADKALVFPIWITLWSFLPGTLTIFLLLVAYELFSILRRAAVYFFPHRWASDIAANQFGKGKVVFEYLSVVSFLIARFPADDPIFIILEPFAQFFFGLYAATFMINFGNIALALATLFALFSFAAMVLPNRDPKMRDR